VGYGYTVRSHGRWAQAEVPESDLRAQPNLSGDPGGQALQDQGHSGGLGGAHLPLPGDGVHPKRQRTGFYCPGPTELV